ncbi:MAG: DNA mismatch repair endonuclease MutL [Clostridiales bacterium]|nr:DNA mismatch repair endonuclease MutL [Clostridiales bacterium]
MPEIKLLSQETIDKIAAGEVVERPSSVVKELVENAIDAKATAITVEIKEGGISFIRITDNGCGIEREQVPMAFLRHSTSKIKAVEDLLSITSLGFRGEALSSIAAVSQVELITKTYGELTGTRYVIEGSKETANEEIGAPEGTTFLVRNLFYNVPARRKFLKTAQTEGNYINDLMERLALSHPDVSFKFISNGQTKMHTAGNSKEKDLIYHIYGRDITASLLPIEKETPLFKVKGFIGKPLISRGNRNYENYFINGRYVKSALLSKAIEEAYKGFVMQHQYPFCVLYFTIDTNLLDVNVHPTKMELRFSNNEEIYKTLFEIIRGSLTHKDFIPEVPVDEAKAEEKKLILPKTPEPFERKRLDAIRKSVAKDSPYERKYPKQASVHPGSDSAVNKETNIPENQAVFDRLLSMSIPLATAPAEDETEKKQTEKNGLVETVQETVSYKELQSDITYEQQQLENLSDSFLTKDARKKHQMIGQLFDTYWLIQYEDKLFIVDQHAAHEKVLYEKTLKKVQAKTFTSQTLSPPVILTLNLEEVEMLEKYQKEISAFGYGVEPFGGKEYAITAIPADFTGIDMKNMFIEMLDDFANINGKDAPNLVMEKVASMSCKAAIKGNQHISREEAEELIDELLQLENPYNCPHGRPTIISMSKYEIEKKFKRIV